MIRVLQMIGSLGLGGSQSMIMNIYCNIDRSKIQFDFVLSHTGPGHEYFVEEAKSLGARIFETPTFNGLNSALIRRTWDKFFTEHPEYKVMHIHLTSFASVYIPVAKKHGVKVIVHSHSISSGGGLMGAYKDYLQRPLRDQADVLMACSADAAVWLYGRDVFQRDNYVFLPNAVELDKFAPNDALREQYRRELGLEGKYVVGHVGRFFEPKNHPFLIKVFAKLLEKRPDAHLLLVGDGENRTKAAEQISSLGIESAVTMTGNRNDVAGLMQAMDIFAFPSLWEGLPVTLVEAQAAGLPCIISDRISKDTDLTPLIKRLPIDSADEWAQELSREHEHMLVTEEVRRSGFDIKGSVQKISEIYTTLAGEKANV